MCAMSGWRWAAWRTSHGAPQAPRQRCADNPATEASFRAAAEQELRPAKGLRDNAFKIELAKRAIVATLAELTGKEPR